MDQISSGEAEYAKVGKRLTAPSNGGSSGARK